MNIFEYYLLKINEIILDNKSNLARAICDFIAGMTDRYAINLYNKIK